MSDLDELERREIEEDPDADDLDIEAGDRVERKKKKKHRRQDEEDEEEQDEDEDEDEDGDEDEDDDDEDEEGEGDPGEARGKKRRKRQKKPAVNRFLDLVADVDDEEDDEEEDEEDVRDAFFEEVTGEGDDLDDVNRRAAHHARFDRKHRELNDEDLARIAQDVTRRYRPTAQRYTGDMNEIPQRLLMPSVQDPNLWQIRVRPGKEREIVFALMRKALDQEFGAKPLEILSAFQRDSLPGMIYVEARSSQQVAQAINGLVGVFPSRGITLVPIEEMASLLQIKKKDTVVTPGSWVRIRRGKYGGDLAQVIDIAENGEEVGLKFVPRIDLNPKDEIISADGKKRKLKGAGFSSASRPPQRFFNYEEVAKVYGRRAVAKRNQVYVFNNDTFKDGYIEKDFKLSALILENVNPTLDEIMKFTRQEDGAENEANVDLSIIAEAAKKEAIQVLQPGDQVEVFEGEQLGVTGLVDSIANDVVTIRASGVDVLEGQKVDVPARSVRKRFRVGDHVKVMSGRNADETGLVVSVVDNVVTFLSDMTMQEVSVFSKDLREAAEVGSSTNIVGDYELHDLVQLDMQTVGVIFKTERESFRVLDQNGQVRVVQPHQIAMRRDSNRAIATDSEGHELRVGDNVKEVEGEERKGQVLHIHQSFYVYLYNREYTENDGVFVTRARILASLAPKSNVPKPGSVDLTKMNPALRGGIATGGMVGSQMSRGPRDPLIGALVVIVKGPQKGLIGIVKDTNGPFARVELQIGNRVITVDKLKLRRKNADGSLGTLDKRQGGNRIPPQFGWGNTKSLPFFNPYKNNFGGTTPAHTASRTPNPYAQDSSKTPAWGRTPNPYVQQAQQGGPKTPSWNAASPQWSRTPNPYARDNAGGKTPAWTAPNDPSWAQGAASPKWQSGQPSWPAPEKWGEPLTAATPFTAATPAASAPTPAAAPVYPDEGSSTSYGGWGGGMFSQTPAELPATPWAGLTDGPADDRPSEDMNAWWRQGRNVVEKMVVDFEGTDFPGREWLDGRLEKKQGVVVSVLDTHKEDMAVALVDVLPDRVEEHRVPVKYLKPHPPSVGDYCVVFGGDSHKGLRLPMMFREGSTAMMDNESVGLMAVPYNSVSVALKE
ncbi:SPT5 [Sanghuangporus weigelae]